ncbi:MAG: SCO1664 family protein [Micrococcaceae bacterium]|nr:SCO1664 family protein [Micrococcaceae bacterium]
MSPQELLTAELELTGRITTASNATFLGSIGEVRVVYKPTAGEKPLWDFPHGTLAHREVAAFLVSETLGWNLVPHTWLRDGPFGEGMVQLWQEPDPARHAVKLLPTEQLPARGWKTVLRGQDDNGQLVTLLHEDSPELRRMAIFDALVNNADRKGDHILAMSDGHRYGVDHGLSFHHEPKLRTVLWGWIDQPISEEELDGIDQLTQALSRELGQELAKLLSSEELSALADRCTALRQTGQFPAPSSQMPAVPWPVF